MNAVFEGKEQGTCSESDVDEFWGYQTCVYKFFLITPNPIQQPHPCQTTSQIPASNVLRLGPLRGVVVNW